MQEATIELPEQNLLDRSINILVFGDPKKPFNIVVTRDHLGNYKNVEEFLKKQMHLLSEQEDEFKEHEIKKLNLNLAPSGKPCEAAEASVSYQHEGRDVYQKIVAIVLPKDRRVLSIAGTFTDQWPKPMQAQWRQIINGLVLR